MEVAEPGVLMTMVGGAGAEADILKKIWVTVKVLMKAGSSTEAFCRIGEKKVREVEVGGMVWYTLLWSGGRIRGTMEGLRSILQVSGSEDSVQYLTLGL